MTRIIFAGDDLTDEDAMKALKVEKCKIITMTTKKRKKIIILMMQGMAYSFRVVNSGLVTTLANHRLSDTKGVFYTFIFHILSFLYLYIHIN